MIYQVVVFGRSFDTAPIHYKVPKKLHESIRSGMIVSVPYGNDSLVGLILLQSSEKDIDSKTFLKLKEIDEIVTHDIIIREEYLKLIPFVAKQYLTPVHNALGLYFPKHLLGTIMKDTYKKISPASYSYNTPAIQLSNDQIKVFNNLIKAKNSKHIIFGVTGSGKTEIYAKYIQHIIASGKQVLLLIPEIVLTSQIGQRMKKLFGDDVVLLHSQVTSAKRSKYWKDIYLGNAKFIIGTRSSLFYPYKDLGAIIIDEEHDKSYISENAPRYHSVTVAEELSDLLDIPLILGSGTPRITSIHKAVKGEYELHQLTQKFRED